MRLPALVAFAAFAVATTARAVDPDVVVHHQGRLLDAADAPITAVTPITLTFFDSKDDDDDAGWTATYAVSPAANGVYAVAIGEAKDVTGKLVVLTASDVAGTKWLGIKVEQPARIGRWLAREDHEPPVALVAPEEPVVASAPSRIIATYVRRTLE